MSIVTDSVPLGAGPGLCQPLLLLEVEVLFRVRLLPYLPQLPLDLYLFQATSAVMRAAGPGVCA